MNNYAHAGPLTQLTVLIACLLPLVHSALYPYGLTNGDSLINEKFLEFNINPIRFLGSGEISGLWANEGGSLTHKELQQDSLDSLSDNVAMCPLFEAPAPDTKIYYRQVKDDVVLFDTITQDVRTSALLPELPISKTLQDKFIPNWAMLVTWENTLASGETNRFQLTITTNGQESFAIYNYQDKLTLWGDQATFPFAGLYASGEDKSKCYVSLEGSQNENIVEINTKGNVPGKLGRFVMIVSEPFLCQTNYSTQCGALPDETARWGNTDVYFENKKNEDGDDYEMHALFTCDEGFHISEGVRTQKIACTYDSDYYDSTWQLGSPQKCIDLEATRQFDVRTIFRSINGEDIIFQDDMSDNTTEVYKQLEEIAKDSFEELLDKAGIIDVSISITNIRSRKLNNQTFAEIEYSVKIPPYIQKRLNSTKLQEKIEETLNDDNTIKSVEYDPFSDVSETTKDCQTACLCRNQKSIELCPRNIERQIQTNMCCGGCKSMGLGNAYASEIKGCCGHVIFDPLKAICCNGRIKKRTEENIRTCKRSQIS